MTVSDVFMPCSRIATRVKTSIRGPYSSPAIFYRKYTPVHLIVKILPCVALTNKVESRTWGKLIMRTGIIDSISLRGKRKHQLASVGIR